MNPRPPRKARLPERSFGLATGWFLAHAPTFAHDCRIGEGVLFSSNNVMLGRPNCQIGDFAF